MTLYWYNSSYKPLVTWAKVFASKIFQRSEKEALKLNIIGYSHHIELENQGDGGQKSGFTEVLASEIPMSILGDALEFELKPNLNLSGPNWELWTTKFSVKEIDNFLKVKDCLFYNFDPNQECWTIIRWEFIDKDIKFETLHSYPEQKLNLWSKSNYIIS